MRGKEGTFKLLTAAYAKVFARRRWYAANKFLFNLALRGLGILSQDTDRSITHGEIQMLRTLARQWTSMPTILDVGAHHGAYSAQVRAVAPDAKIYAFEPNPDAFQILKNRSVEYGLVALNLACGEQRTTLPLYDYVHAQGSVHASLYQDVFTSLHRGNTTATYVQVVPLHMFLQEEGITHVQLVKIDTEGHELMVLNGLKPMLSANCIDAIQFEFNTMNIISRTFFRDFYLTLPQYDLFRILPDGPVPLGEYQPLRCEVFGRQEILAVRRESGIRV